MSNKITFKNNIPTFYKHLDTAIHKASLISGREIVAGAKRLARVQTGQMRDSYQFKTTMKGKRNEFSNTQQYFAFQEQGTKYIKPMDSYITTIDRRADKIARNYKNQIQREANKMK